MKRHPVIGICRVRYERYQRRPNISAWMLKRWVPPQIAIVVRQCALAIQEIPAGVIFAGDRLTRAPQVVSVIAKRDVLERRLNRAWLRPGCIDKPLRCVMNAAGPAATMAMKRSTASVGIDGEGEVGFAFGDTFRLRTSNSNSGTGLPARNKQAEFGELFLRCHDAPLSSGFFLGRSCIKSLQPSPHRS